MGGVGRGGVNGGQGTWGRKGRKDGGDRVAGAFSSWRILLRSAAAESGTVRVRYCAIWSDRNLLPRSQILFIALKAPTIATGPRPSPSSTRKKGSERSRAMSVPGGWCRQKWSVVGGRRYYRDEVPPARCCGSSGLESGAARVSSPPSADPVPFFTCRRWFTSITTAHPDAATAPSTSPDVFTFLGCAHCAWHALTRPGRTRFPYPRRWATGRVC